jgi:hypothetical protein
MREGRGREEEGTKEGRRKGIGRTKDEGRRRFFGVQGKDTVPIANSSFQTFKTLRQELDASLTYEPAQILSLVKEALVSTTVAVLPPHPGEEEEEGEEGEDAFQLLHQQQQAQLAQRQREQLELQRQREEERRRREAEREYEESIVVEEQPEIKLSAPEEPEPEPEPVPVYEPEPEPPVPRHAFKPSSSSSTTSSTSSLSTEEQPVVVPEKPTLVLPEPEVIVNINQSSAGLWDSSSSEDDLPPPGLYFFPYPKLTVQRRKNRWQGRKPSLRPKRKVSLMKRATRSHCSAPLRPSPQSQQPNRPLPPKTKTSPKKIQEGLLTTFFPRRKAVYLTR